jgi:hypothetical protein
LFYWSDDIIAADKNQRGNLDISETIHHVLLSQQFAVADIRRRVPSHIANVLFSQFRIEPGEIDRHEAPHHPGKVRVIPRWRTAEDVQHLAACPSSSTRRENLITVIPGRVTTHEDEVAEALWILDGIVECDRCSRRVAQDCDLSEAMVGPSDHYIGDRSK